MVKTITVEGRTYTVEELEALLGIDTLEPPYDTAELQRLVNEANQDDGPLSELLLAALLLALATGLTGGDRLVYATRQQQYYQGTRALTQVDLQRRVSAESMRNAARMQRRTQQLIDGGLSLDQWQRDMARDIVRSQFRMAQAGAGTAGNLTPAHLESLRSRIRGELAGLNALADDLANGRISEKMATYRAGRRGSAAGAAFWEAQHVSHSDGRWEAMRRLQPGADHCSRCPEYSTNGEWRPAESVVAKGVDCPCGGNCLCMVIYRTVTLSDRLPKL
jgi:hypothetical protein